MICAALGALALAGGWLWPLLGRAYLFRCPMKSIAGIPCAACGGTRAAVALSHGRFAEALAMNPLAAAGIAMCLGVALLAAVEFLSRGRIGFGGIYALGAKTSAQLAFRAAIIAAVLANWIYLIVVGR